MSHTDRVVVLVDMDCFYCQVEENLDPRLKGRPMAVVQYNTWKGGGIIAVNYPARDRGVTRHMRGDEAKRKCPEIELVHVPAVRGKADLTKYRDAGKLVASVLQKFSPLLERASVDEAYLDITEGVAVRQNFAKAEIQLGQIINTHVVGCETMEFLYSLYDSGLCDEANLKLAYGAVIAEEIRAAVFRETGYTCSAGIAHNKILAKLAAGLNKPNRQTLLPQDGVEPLYKDLPVRKIRSLGGKFGDSLSEDLGVATMAELVRFTLKELRKRYDEKTASWLYNIARGIDLEPVTIRLVSKSIGCAKTFPGRNALTKPESLRHWLGELSAELAERLEKDLDENNRRAKQMTVGFTQDETPTSRVHSLSSYDAKKIADDSYALIQRHCTKGLCITNLSINAGKFEDCRNVTAITSFFKSKTTAAPDEETGNYSDETVDLNEDISKLTFYKEAEESDDSITTEIPTTVDDEDEAKGSFFLRYFEEMRNAKKRESPAVRDFDTSRNLEDDEPSTSNNGTEICDECNRPVPIAEMISHKDHHLALQIAKQQKLARTPVIATKTKETAAKSKKRKSTHTGTLTKFLQSTTATLSEEDSEECPQCRKRIRRGELDAHLDYHLARELHREINQVKSFSSERAPKTAKKIKATKSMTSTRSVTSFFKPN